MRRISWIAPLLLLPAVLLPLRALAQETLEKGEADTVTHAESGFSMLVPDGWDREPEREGAGVLVLPGFQGSLRHTDGPAAFPGAGVAPRTDS